MHQWVEFASACGPILKSTGGRASYGTQGGWNKLKTLVDAHEDADVRHQAFVERIAPAARKIHAHFSTFKNCNR
jgi:hypothetical protein